MGSGVSKPFVLSLTGTSSPSSYGANPPLNGVGVAFLMRDDERIEELRSDEGGVGVDETLGVPIFGVPMFGVGGVDRTDVYDR